MANSLWDQDSMYIWPRANRLYRLSFREINHQRWEVLKTLEAQSWFDKEHKDEFLKRTWFILGDEPVDKGT